MEEIKMTQAELDALIAERTAKAKEGLLTEDDFTRKVTSEVDRRVESGIQKGLETQKSKWEKEFTEKAQLTAEELAQKEINQKLGEVEAREKELQLKANKLDAISMFSEAGVAKKDYDKMMSVLINSDEESTKANVANFIELFNSNKQEVEARVKSEMGHIPSPKSGKSSGGSVTKETFGNLSYNELMEFKKENPEQYSEFMK